jgi:hypothetical protein
MVCGLVGRINYLRSEAQKCNRLSTGIAGSNPMWTINVCLYADNKKQNYVTYSVNCRLLVLKTILLTQLVDVFLINVGTKFQTPILSALSVTFIKATKMFLFYIQPKYSHQKYCIFFQATLLYKMVELIINVAGDCWMKLYACVTLMLLNAENWKECLLITLVWVIPVVCN